MNLDQLDAALSRAGTATARKMTADLRRRAYEAGWPSEAGRSLEVRHDQGHFEVAFPEQARELVETLEYGTQEKPPTAVLRKFVTRIPYYTSYFHSRAMTQLVRR